MPKRILMLGAGNLQVPGIEIAKKMKMEVIVTDGNPAAPGLPLADISRPIDLKNVEETLKIAKEFEINGIMSNVNDAGVYTAAVVARKLGLVGIDPEIAKAATNKAAMRKIWQDKGVPVPRFKLVTSNKEALEAAEAIGFPLIVKPTDRSGSRGVVKVETKEQVASAFESAVKSSLEKKILVEEFMEGTEHSVEALSYKGKVHVLGVSDKLKALPPYRYDIGVIYPTALSKEKKDQLTKVAVDAINALGIDVGATHTEISFTRDGPKIIEAHARCGGGNISTHIIPAISGVNMMKELIKITVGIEPDFTPKYTKAAVLKFIISPPGKVREIHGIDKLFKKEWVIDSWMGIKNGDCIHETVDGPGRAGHFIVVGENREEALRRAKEASDMVTVTLDKE